MELLELNYRVAKELWSFIKLQDVSKDSLALTIRDYESLLFTPQPNVLFLVPCEVFREDVLD